MISVVFNTGLVAVYRQADRTKTTDGVIILVDSSSNDLVAEIPAGTPCVIEHMPAAEIYWAAGRNGGGEGGGR